MSRSLPHRCRPRASGQRGIAILSLIAMAFLADSRGQCTIARNLEENAKARAQTLIGAIRAEAATAAGGAGGDPRPRTHRPPLGAAAFVTGLEAGLGRLLRPWNLGRRQKPKAEPDGR